MDWLEKKDDVFFVTGTQVDKLSAFKTIAQLKFRKKRKHIKDSFAGPTLDD